MKSGLHLKGMDALFELHPQPAALLGPEGLERLNRSARALHLDTEALRRPNGTFTRARDPNGRIRYLQLRRVVLPDDRVLVTLEDVTRLQALEAEVAWLKRSDALGLLTGSLVRELGALLTPMSGLAVTLASALADDGRLSGLTRELESATSLAVRLVQRLSAYARPGPAPAAQVDPAVVIAELRPVLELVGGGGVELRVSYGDAGQTQVDRVLLERALLGLVMQAREATEEGGAIEVWTGRVELPQGTARRLGCPREGEYLTITVRDSGTGLAPEAQRRIFEGVRADPGLAQVYRFVQESGGGMALESAPGDGTTVVLYLPALGEERTPTHDDEPSVEVPSLESWPKTAPRNRHTVLVVDGDAHVREALQRSLEAAGYVALTAGSGRHALEAMARAKVDLVLTEVVMLGVDGVQLARGIAERGLPAAVMFMSGHDDGVLRRYGVLPRCRALLRKPFSPSELTAAVRRRLDGGAEAVPCVALHGERGASLTAERA